MRDLLTYFADETLRADRWDEYPGAMRASLERWRGALNELRIEYRDGDEADEGEADQDAEEEIHSAHDGM
jgi:hypothetical protein